MEAKLSSEQFTLEVGRHAEFESRFWMLLDAWSRFSIDEKKQIQTAFEEAQDYETWGHLTQATDTRYHLLQLELHDAFKDVKLEDGIGFHEADCIDDYLTPDDPVYQKWKALDEREDWRKLIKKLEGYVYFSQPSFMDEKGLRFFLPVLLVLGAMTLEFVLTYVVEDPSSKHRRMWESLTLAQKNVVIASLEYEVDYRFSVLNLMQDLPCTKCGTMTCHCARKGLTQEEAVAQVEQSERHVLAQKLRQML